MHNISLLPFLPISPSVLAESPFFLSKDARIVRAGFFMLDAAWRADLPGSIPSSFEALALITRLPEELVADNYVLLTAGWELEGGRLHHLQMEAIAESVQERFGAQLAVVAESAILACQGGSVEFELMPSTEVAKKKKGKHALPKDFLMDKATLERAAAEGFTTEETMTWLKHQFTDYAHSKDVRMANWQATCRNFLSNSYTADKFRSKFGHNLGQAPVSSLVTMGTNGSSARDRLRSSTQRAAAPVQSTFAQRSASHNSDVMAGALARRTTLAPQDQWQDAPGMGA